MMSEADLIRIVRNIVRSELAKTLLGSITKTENSYVTSIQRFSTDSEIQGLRLIRPYGFASRPTEDTQTVVHPINGDPSHLVSLGDFDQGNRPELEDGESIVYGSDGQMMHMEDGGDIVFGDYNPETGTILPTYRAKWSDDGTREIKNENSSFTMDPDGTITAENDQGTFEIKPSGEFNMGNSSGSFKMDPSGDFTLDGPFVNLGTGASHGAGLGDVIEQRLSALESALSALTTNVIAHTHPVISLGSPTGTEVPPATPFIPTPTPVESQTVKVST